MEPANEEDVSRRQPIVTIAGVTFKPDKKSKLEMAPETYTSFVHEANKTALADQAARTGRPVPNDSSGRPPKLVSAPSPIVVQVPDTGRYKNQKPVPTVDNKYVALSGRLMQVVRTQGESPKVEHFNVDIESIAFLGTAAVSPVAQPQAPTDGADDDAFGSYNTESPSVTY